MSASSTNDAGGTVPRSPERDHELGMDRRITRRDFLDGVALTVGGLMLGGSALSACGWGGASRASFDTPDLSPYPPALTGMRGSTNAAYQVPHKLVDGAFWKAAGKPAATDETYDLVVVGGGISGLSAAYFYSRRHQNARILVLDNHDDFGGHARRAEFDGGRLIGYLGTESIATPSEFSRESMGLLEDIGIRPQAFERYYDRGFYRRRGLKSWATFFDRETWGRDHVAIGSGGTPMSRLLKDAPMSPEGKRDLVMLHEAPKDWLPGLSDAGKKQRLSEITYAQYLQDVAKVHPDASKYLANLSNDEWGYGSDGIGAIDAWGEGYPGFDGLGLDWSKPFKYSSPTMKSWWDATDPYIYHFPEGGAGVSRLLVRALIPGALPGHTMEDEVLARLDYSRLDVAGNSVRIRLGSPVVRVRHVGDPARAGEVDVVYARDGTLESVQARGVVLACWYSMIPYICDEFPAEQKQAMRFMTRVPLVYAGVEIRNWRAFKDLGVVGVQPVGPGAFWSYAELDMPVSMGGYTHPRDPDEPILVHFSASLTQSGMPLREGARAGRWKLYGLSFADIEREIRELLARSLGGGGFDPAADIQAITLGRWGHGYSIEYVSPWDNAFYPDGPLPGDVAATRLGRIVMAGTDRSSRAYIDSAIDAAFEAVNQL
jgi:spermidine dehydrogenase